MRKNHPVHLDGWHFVGTSDFIGRYQWVYRVRGRYYAVVSHQVTGWMVSIDPRPRLWDILPLPITEGVKRTTELEGLRALQSCLNGRDAPYRTFWVNGHHYFQESRA